VDLVVLDTPLQLLNCREALHQFGASSARIVILQWPWWPRSAFDSILKSMDLKEVAFVRMLPGANTAQPSSLARRLLSRFEWLRSAHQMLLRQKLQRHLRRFGAIRRMFVGNYRNAYMRHCANVVAPGEVILVDDGTDAVVFAAELVQGVTAENVDASVGSIKRFKRWVRTRWIDWDERIAPRLVFFSVYKFATRPADLWLPNNYDCLRASVAASQASEEVLFLGQPLAEDGHLTLTRYVERVLQAANDLGIADVRYVPHPREAAETTRLVCERLGTPARRLGMPLEIALATTAQRPRAIASFFCSALENCSVLFDGGLRVVAYRLPRSDLLGAADTVEQIYRHLESANRPNFHCINLWI